MIINAFIPRGYRVERSIEIAQDAETILLNIHSPKTYYNWMPWQIPKIEHLIMEKDDVANTKINWIRDHKKNQIMIIATNKSNNINMQINLENDKRKLKAIFIISPIESDKSRISFALQGERTFITRFMNLLMDKFIGKEINLSLNKLKQLSEKER